MRVLGIDPGTVATGYGLVEEEGESLFHICSGVIKTSSKDEFSKRLKIIYDGIASVIKDFFPDVVAIEEVFFARDVKAALKLGHARGVAVLASANSGLSVAEYSPTAIKKAVVGYGRGEKYQTQRMVQTLLGLSSLPEPHDAADALAVAICHIHNASFMARLENTNDRFA